MEILNMSVTKLLKDLNGTTKNSILYTNEKIDDNKLKKLIDDCVKSMNDADSVLRDIASLLQSDQRFDVRKDILSFLININDMSQYLVTELQNKINPPVEDVEKK